MNGTLIASTPRGNMHPLAYQGILATDCHHQIVSILRSRLGDSHVLLFAEPAFDSSRDIVDWYSPVQGTPVRLIDLPVERQDSVRGTLLKMAADILTQAQQLKDTGDSNRILSGSIVELALQYPGEDCIYLVGEQPVLVCWGFGPATTGAKPQDLTRLAALSPRQVVPQSTVSEPSPPQPAAAETASPPSGPVPGPNPRRRLPWWLLLLLLLLVGLLLWYFYGNKLKKRWFPEPVGQAATAPAGSDELTAALARGKALRQERDGLLTSLAKKSEQCNQPEKRADPQRGTELQVPENVSQDTGLGFLQGGWRCDSDLSTPKDPVVVEYIFDAAGKGQITVKTSQKICSAGVQASLDPSGTLRIESDAAIPCSTGSPIDGQRVECVGKGAQTTCEGLNITSQGKWRARFLKY